MRNNSLPRGLRNNNPGNIRRNSDAFQGEKTSSDREFKQFKLMAYGYRAIFKILSNYYRNYKLGYDPELLGFERVHNITKRIRRAGKSPEGIQPAPKFRMRVGREQFGAAELEKMSRRESERRMQQEIVYLQQQMAFLKKLMRQPESADSDT